jgi:hypothetical protein
MMPSLGAPVHVFSDDLAEIHPVELVAAQDEHPPGVVALQVGEGLAHRIGGPLVPVHLVLERLAGGQDVHEPGLEVAEGIGGADVAVEAGRVELGEDEDAVQSRVEGIADGDVDQAELAAQRHGRFAAVLGQGVQTRTTSPAEDQGDHIVHGADLAAGVDHGLLSAG